MSCRVHRIDCVVAPCLPVVICDTPEEEAAFWKGEARQGPSSPTVFPGAENPLHLLVLDDFQTPQWPVVPLISDVFTADESSQNQTWSVNSVPLFAVAPALPAAAARNPTDAHAAAEEKIAGTGAIPPLVWLLAAGLLAWWLMRKG